MKGYGDMRKRTAAAIVIMLLLAGCGQRNEIPAVPETEVTEAPRAPKTTAAPKETEAPEACATAVPETTEGPEATATPQAAATEAPKTTETPKLTEVPQKTENWGLGFGKEGQKPKGNATVEELAKYGAYFCGTGEEKVLYLTFDCGYENGNTEPILDALKKHDAPATFFVVGHFLESAPEVVKRMVEEGHTVGNHTYHHPDMSKISDKAAFQKEMDDVRTLFHDITGTDLAMYYRPPQGKYSVANLQMAQELGYSTFFWSLAYVDWNQNDQPSHEEAMKKLMGRVHPGAIVLLHSTSKTNGEILDEVLTKWEEMGYTFRPLSDLTEGTAADSLTLDELSYKLIR